MKNPRHFFRIAICVIAGEALNLIAASVGAAPQSALGPAADPLVFKREAWPLIERHCISCHGPKKQKMGIDFSTMTDLPSILGHRDVWRKAREALEAEDMPQDPEETGFTPADRKNLVAWIKTRIETIDRSSPIYRDPGPPLIRQLTRQEYNNTIRDLLQIQNFDAARAGGIADESEYVIEHFANLAAGQTIDQTLLEKYMAAADGSLAHLFEDAGRRDAKLKAARDAVFFTRPGKGVSDQEAARAVLGRFVHRAFRGPVDPATLDQLLQIVDQSIKSGDNFEQAIRKAMKPVLVAPQFLYRIEEDRAPAGSSEGARVSDNELAVRLSYFIWATMPDDELFKLADAGQLSHPDILAAQVTRMLADPKAKALTDYFAVQWLQLNRLRRALPGQNVFPAFTNPLKDSMQQEATLFFDAIRTEDRSVLDLLDGDYTFVNEDLARLYGIPGVTGKKMRRVALKPEYHRGGVLGMGAILAMTSHTDRTKPTTRGKWILDVMLGTPPPPPPANVSNFAAPKDKNAAPKTFRERLAQHATDSTCAACHKRIDPLGFALENYNAIGEWRDQIAGEPVDNAGRLPGGKEFHGVDGLKQILRARQDQFVANVATQMMTYALGRQLQYQDDLALADIVDSLKHDGYKFSTLIRGVAASRPFMYRKNFTTVADAAPTPPRGRQE
ncbi:MAG TPA: DUF1592 domain-containing protein [Tepidisphaeraceae bacterium]|jgi:mono/diheme cytochrome c family protein|nr:DUF1592 domain-containing protein [Tepidisphaeraceae bacterium]